MVYLIVEFCNNGDIALVPDNWMSGEQNVYWPPYKTSTRLNNAVVKKEPRSDSWSLEPIKRILYKNESYEKVRAKLRTAEEESDLQTDDEQILVEGKRKRRKPNWCRISSSDESDDELQSSVLNSPPPSVQLQRLQSPHTPRPPPRLPLLPVSPIPSTSLPMSPRPMPGANGSAPVLAVTGIANQALATQILTLLEVLKEELFEQRRVLQLLVSNGTIEDRAALPEGILFPLSTTEEMDSFNDILRVSDSYSSVVRYLAMFGGSTVRDTISRILKEVMTSDLAKKFNFRGQKGKLPFGSLNILSVLHRCIQRNPSTKTATRKDTETEVRKWLAGARDRDGGRKKRESSQEDHTASHSLDNSDME